MKVAFISRSTLFSDRGGDTVQIENTAQNLKKLGVEIDILLSTDTINYSVYDFLHFFNIIRPADILMHIEKSKRPFVVSTIFVDYSEFEKTQRTGITGIVFKLLSSDLIEYVKVLGRFIIKREQIISPSYLWMGQRRSIKKIIRKSSLLLPNSNSEYERLYKHYGVKQAYRIIPNAIDPALFRSDALLDIKDKKLVICVGRIEGRKNQLNLIRAMNNTRFKVLIIGAFASNQKDYAQACRSEAAANITFINNLPQQQLISYYKKAVVHVLPSWFETTGLSSLEAAVMGCNIVITDKGDTKEYFGDMAYYCNPGSPDSIREAIIAAADSAFNESLRERILTEYTWPVTATETLQAYKIVLQKTS